MQGTLAYELFERALLHHRFDAASLKGHIAAILAAHLDDMAAVRESDEKAMEAHLLSLISPIQRGAATAFTRISASSDPAPACLRIQCGAHLHQ